MVLELVARSRRHRARLRLPLTGAGDRACVLLAVFVPLFATADAAFAHLLGELVPDEAVDLPVGRFATWIGVARRRRRAAGAGRAPGRRPLPPAGRALGAHRVGACPLIALVALFAAFVALQLAALYGGHDYVLRTAGLTYAEYAREGFAQLLVGRRAHARA